MSKFIIFTTLSMLETFRREFVRFAPKLKNQVLILQGDATRKREQWLSSGKRVFITNHDTINTKFGEWLEKEATDILGIIVDESHKFKGATAKRTKRLMKLSKKCRYLLAMTGSPVLNDERDLWSQLYLIDPSILGANYREFLSRYFVNLNRNAPQHVTWPNWTVRQDRREELMRKVSSVSDDCKKADVLVLPSLVKTSQFVTLADEALRPYLQMEREFLTFFDNNIAKAEIVLTKLLRLQQICNGFVTTETGATAELPCNKYDALTDILESISKQHKTIIWTNFRATYQPLSDRLSKLEIPHVFLTGDQLSNIRQQNIDTFNHDANCRVIVANPQAGGAGISLTAASYMIYFSKGYSPEADRQSEARAHRGGSEIHDKITRIDLVTQNTVEEEIDAALKRKSDVGEFLYELRKRFASSEAQSRKLSVV